MIKLLKYEFRKSMAGLLSLIGVGAALEGYFLIALRMRLSNHVAIATVLLTICACAASIFVFARGLTAYTSELKSKSAYLIFMTPNSGLKIMASKFLYTFANGLLVGTVSVALVLIDLDLLLRQNVQVRGLLDLAKVLMRNVGVYVDQLGLFAAAILIMAILSVLSFFALAYIAVTISHTLLRDKKGRGVIALVIFIGLEALVSWIGSKFPSPINELEVLNRNVYDTSVSTKQTIESLNALIPYMVPSACLSLACILASLFGCAWMLDKKISL